MEPRKKFAIHRFVGWWFVMKDGIGVKAGQITATGDVHSTIKLTTGVETTAASSALLDTRFTTLYPSELSMQEAVQR